ncbi:hypothetical protein F0562_026070 [Nyssa sinensis]|uniref:Response regulatory domain-containing protein n=1 Tax=Nyssa sinensis TaxID=561372 RepID=A0A5J5B9T5_9ASTE|nr:hypothetical protein F0562_026070 [Nyssa sinensis]
MGNIRPCKVKFGRIGLCRGRFLETTSVKMNDGHATKELVEFDHQSVQMNDGRATKGLVEFNHHMWDEQKEVLDGVAGECKRLSKEDKLRINEDTEDINCEFIELVEAQAVLPRQQGPVIHWERFLPLRSLKVLLVEDDASTCHVVSALLRNCSYEG